MASTAGPRWWTRLPVLAGVRPVDRRRVPAELLAGLTLAAVAIPEVMGYSRIAGMPVITGLYTILLPLAAFAVIGSSRHLSVGADSATAAVMAAGLGGLALAGTRHYVALAGALALMAAVFLVVARIIRIGFLADFLSRTVLIGFLTGVGIEVAIGQVGGMLGLSSASLVRLDGHRVSGTVGRLAATVDHLAQVSWATVAVSAATLAVVVGSRRINRAVPGALVAVGGTILVSWHWDLGAHGVALVGPVPSGLPAVGLPDVGWADLVKLVGTAGSLFVLILAQSAATSRAFAARYEEDVDENRDLLGLGLANVMAGVTGTFAVNGSPTRTQLADSAGGRTQLAQLSTVVVVGLVLVLLTHPLEYLPVAVLASVVFVIGIELVDLKGLHRVLTMRTDEFVVATLTALTVVVLGVEQGIVLAVVASIVAHLRRSYRPAVAVLVPATDHPGWHGITPAPEVRTVPGLVIYRFASSIYYANANHLVAGITAFVRPAPSAPLRWLCLDAEMVGDIDVTGGQALRAIHDALAERGVRFVIAEPIHQVRDQLARYGIIDLLGADAVFPTVRSALKAFQSSSAP